MNIYNLTFMIIISTYIGIYFFKDKIKYNSKKLFLIIVGILLISLSTFRDNSVSIDLNLYLDIFQSTKNHSIFNIVLDSLNFNHLFMTDIFNGYYEAGFVLYSKMIYTFFDFDLAFKLFTSMFINIPILWFIYKYSKNELLSVSIYYLFGYYTQSFVILRQYMALSIIIIALHFLLRNENKKFFLLVFLAMFFHKTSICFLIVYFIKKYWRKINEKVFYIIVLTVIMFFVSKPLITFFVDKFYPFYSDKILGGEGLKLLLLLTVVLVTPFILRTMKSIKKFNFAFVIFFIGVLLQIFTYNFSLLNRLALYFQFFIILFIPNCVTVKKYRHIFNVFVILCFFVFFNFVILKDNGSQINNYKFINEIIFYGY